MQAAPCWRIYGSLCHTRATSTNIENRQARPRPRTGRHRIYRSALDLQRREEMIERKEETDVAAFEPGHNIPSQTPILTWALEYARQGYSIFPVWGVLSNGTCACNNSACSNVGKHPKTSRGFHDATIDETTIMAWFGGSNPPNIGIATEASGFDVIDVDPRHGGLESLEKLEAKLGLLQTTLRARTGGGGEHVIFRADSSAGAIRSRSNAFGPEFPGVDVRGFGGYIVAPPSKHRSGKRYEWIAEGAVEALDELPTLSTSWRAALDGALTDGVVPLASPHEFHIVPSGEGHDYLRNRLYSMRKQGDSEPAIRAYAYAWRDNQYERPELYPDQALDILIASTMKRVEPSEEIKTETIGAENEATIPEIVWDEPQQWPKLEDEALHGLAGDFVRLVMPHSEADCAALLTQFLCAFGCAIGPSAYFLVEATKHFARLFVLIIAKTSSARKGTAMGRVAQIFNLADPDFMKAAHVSGLASGEGLISHLSDRKERINGNEPGEWVDTIIPTEKRALVVEPEFVRTLNAASRDGSILGAVLRDSWDSGRIQNMTRKDPQVVEDANISIIGHITAEELRAKLSTTDIANGFVNRFSLVCTTRRQRLAHGGTLTDFDFVAIADRLRTAMTFARTIERVQRTAAADELWKSYYDNVPEPDGLLGAVTARQEAQVLRLSLTYALLDESTVIDVQHLNAALALYRYIHASAQHIFGAMLGDDVADAILIELRAVHPQVLDRKQMHALFSRHKTSAQLSAAIKYLISHDLAIQETVKTKGASRLTLRASSRSEKSELSE